MAEPDVVLDAATATELASREKLAFVDGAAAYQAAMVEGGRADRQALLSLADLEAGLELLDVCCGPGWLAVEAARQCPGLTVHGVDLSPSMVDLAREHATAEGITGIFTVMDAEMLEFDSSMFDRVTCGWGLMHMPNPVTALKEMARVTRPHGLLAASVWGPASATVQGTLAAALREGAEGRAALDYGYVTRLGDESVMAGMLADAGWTSPRFELLQREWVVPNAELLWMGMSGGTTFGTLVADLDDHDQQAARASFVERCEVYRHPDGIHVPTSQILITARRRKQNDDRSPQLH